MRAIFTESLLHKTLFNIVVYKSVWNRWIFLKGFQRWLGWLFSRNFIQFSMGLSMFECQLFDAHYCDFWKLFLANLDLTPAMGLKLGVFGFLPSTHIKTHAKQYAPTIFTNRAAFYVCLSHALTAVDAGDIRTWQTTVILITANTRKPPIWVPCRNKDDAGSGISGVYLWPDPSSWWV